MNDIHGLMEPTVEDSTSPRIWTPVTQDDIHALMELIADDYKAKKINHEIQQKENKIEYSNAL